MSRLETTKDDLPTLGLPDAWTLLREPVESVTALGTGNRSRVYRITLREGGTRIARVTARGSGRVERERAVRAMLGNDPRVPTVHALFVRAHPLSPASDVCLMLNVPGQTPHPPHPLPAPAGALLP